MSDLKDFKNKNTEFTGTTGIDLPEGTQAQRVDERGLLRFNTDTNLAEYYDGTDWKPIDAPPTITGFTLDGGSVVTSAEIGRVAGDATIVIQGSNFDTTSGTVVFEPESGGANVTTQTITRTSSSSFTVTVTRTDFLEANDPYAIKLTNGSGLAATLASAIEANEPPAFATAADTVVKSAYEGQSAPFSETTLAATDEESDTVTHTISAGSLPPGLSLSTAGALTGTISGSSIQNYTFTVQAATSFGNSTRQFVIAIGAVPFISACGGNATLTSGDFKTHVFTSPGTFVVSGAGTPVGSDTVEYLVVAGGGGAGGGGGGAGGMRYNYPSPATGGLSVSATSYPVTVGGGGSPGSQNSGPPFSAGANSTFSNITSAGGGKGGSYPCGSGPGGGRDGGSGGGVGIDQGGPAGGVGNTPPVSPPQGSNGGIVCGPGGWRGGGGGGGHSQQGGQGNSGGPSLGYGGNGGNGSPIATTFFGPTAPSYGTPGPAPGRWFAGGGSGGINTCGPDRPQANGGAGGGGNFSRAGDAGPGNAGTTNTGGGGGACEHNAPAGAGGAGGSGIVAIRYKFQ